MTNVMEFFLNLLLLRGRILTTAAAETFQEAVRKCLQFKRKIAMDYHTATRMIIPFENMIEVINYNASQYKCEGDNYVVTNEVRYNLYEKLKKTQTRSLSTSSASGDKSVGDNNLSTSSPRGDKSVSDNKLNTSSPRGEKSMSDNKTNKNNENLQKSPQFKRIVDSTNKDQKQDKKQNEKINEDVIIDNLHAILKSQEFLFKNVIKLVNVLEKNEILAKNNKRLEKMKKKLRACTDILANTSHSKKFSNVINNLIEEEITRCRFRHGEGKTSAEISLKTPRHQGIGAALDTSRKKMEKPQDKKAKPKENPSKQIKPEKNEQKLVKTGERSGEIKGDINNSKQLIEVNEQHFNKFENSLWHSLTTMKFLSLKEDYVNMCKCAFYNKRQFIATDTAISKKLQEEMEADSFNKFVDISNSMFKTMERKLMFESVKEELSKSGQLPVDERKIKRGDVLKIAKEENLDEKKKEKIVSNQSKKENFDVTKREYKTAADNVKRRKVTKIETFHVVRGDAISKMSESYSRVTIEKNVVSAKRKLDPEFNNKETNKKNKLKLEKDETSEPNRKSGNWTLLKLQDIDEKMTYDKNPNKIQVLKTSYDLNPKLIKSEENIIIPKSQKLILTPVLSENNVRKRISRKNSGKFPNFVSKNNLNKTDASKKLPDSSASKDTQQKIISAENETKKLSDLAPRDSQKNIVSENLKKVPSLEKKQEEKSSENIHSTNLESKEKEQKKEAKNKTLTEIKEESSSHSPMNWFQVLENISSKDVNKIPKDVQKTVASETNEKRAMAEILQKHCKTIPPIEEETEKSEKPVKTELPDVAKIVSPKMAHILDKIDEKNTKLQTIVEESGKLLTSNRKLDKRNLSAEIDAEAKRLSANEEAFQQLEAAIKSVNFFIDNKYSNKRKIKKTSVGCKKRKIDDGDKKKMSTKLPVQPITELEVQSLEGPSTENKETEKNNDGSAKKQENEDRLRLYKEIKKQTLTKLSLTNERTFFKISSKCWQDSSFRSERRFTHSSAGQINVEENSKTNFQMRRTTKNAMKRQQVTTILPKVSKIKEEKKKLIVALVETEEMKAAKTAQGETSEKCKSKTEENLTTESKNSEAGKKTDADQDGAPRNSSKLHKEKFTL